MATLAPFSTGVASRHRFITSFSLIDYRGGLDSKPPHIFVPHRPDHVVEYFVVDTRDGFISYETGSAAFS